MGRGRQCLNYSKWNSHLLPRWWEDGLGQGRGERDAGYQGIEKYTTLRKLVWHSPFFVKKPITSLNDWQSSGFRAMVVLIHSGSSALMEKIKSWHHSQKHIFELQLDVCQDTWLLQVSTNQENYYIKIEMEPQSSNENKKLYNTTWKYF